MTHNRHVRGFGHVPQTNLSYDIRRSVWRTYPNHSLVSDWKFHLHLSWTCQVWMCESYRSDLGFSAWTFCFSVPQKKMFGMTWGWEMLSEIKISGWTIPLIYFRYAKFNSKPKSNKLHNSKCHNARINKWKLHTRKNLNKHPETIQRRNEGLKTLQMKDYCY